MECPDWLEAVAPAFLIRLPLDSEDPYSVHAQGQLRPVKSRLALSLRTLVLGLQGDLQPSHELKDHPKISNHHPNTVAIEIEERYDVPPVLVIIIGLVFAPLEDPAPYHQRLEIAELRHPFRVRTSRLDSFVNSRNGS